MNRTASHFDIKRLLALLLTAVLLFGAVAVAEEAATISGCAFVDDNQNLICDEGEPLMSGLPVRLYQYIGEEWQEVDTAETDEYGLYQFAITEAGDYCIRSSTTAADYAVLAVDENPESVQGSEDKQSNVLTFSARPGESKVVDISLGVAASAEIVVFEDKNADGKKGQYDEGVKGVLVELLDGDSVIAAGTTGKGGKLTLSGFVPGTYEVRFALPEGYAFSAKGTDFAKGDSVVEPNGSRTAVSDPLSFGTEQAASVGCGVIPVGTFSGKVFEDADNNGIMDETDPGVGGISLRLEGKKTGNVFEMTSNEDGTYFFDLLPADTYLFSATLPEGLMYARYSREGGDLRSVFTGETLVREFPVSSTKRQSDKNVGVIQNGTISGIAFYDLDYDGIRDENEPGYANVTFEAVKISTAEAMGKTVTGEDGSFALEGLRSSDYRLRAILPQDGSVFTCLPAEDGVEGNAFAQNGSSRESRLEPLTVTSGSNVTVQAGVAKGATISGVLFEDANYNGVKDGKERTFSGQLVQLVDENGNVAAQVRSAAKGVYTLEGIMPGTYTLKVERTKTYGFTRLRPAEEGGSYIRELIDGFGVSDPFEIVMAQEMTGVNAGMLPAGTVSGVLFHDANDNGLKDEDEFGLPTVNVRLLSADGEIDLIRQVGEDGSYLFDGVMPGEYTLTYQLPDNTEMAQVVQGGNTLEHAGAETTGESFSVAMGENVTCPLVGAVTLGTLEGVAFHDGNANGQQDEGEEALSGVKLLLSGGGNEYEAVTASDGSYTISEVRPSEYQLTLALPEGYIASSNTGNLILEPRASQSVAVLWSDLISRQPVTFGAVEPAAISGEIRLDENNNGQSETTERMMIGIRLELVNEHSGETQSVTSDENGFVFDTVRPGTYTVRFAVPDQAEPAKIAGSTFRFSGAAMEQTGVTVTEGQQLSGLSTALVSRTSIGGILSLHDEAGKQPVAGVTVTLLDAGDAVLATSVSDETGAYRFDGLWPGDYRIKASLAEGAIFVRPDDTNYPQGASVILTDDGLSGVITLKMAEHRLNENVLYIRTAKVGDLAWVDENANGLLDGSERRLPGVTVQLLQQGQVVYETTTDLHGYYQFAGVYPGSYTLRASAYPELTITTPVPSLRIISSCLTSGDGQSAQSDEFSVESGNVTNDFDLGYVLLPGQQLPQLPEEPTRDWSSWNAQYTSMHE